MSTENAPTSEMLGRMAAQLMVLYDDALTEGRTEAAQAYAMSLNVLRNESVSVPIRFGGPPPTLRTVPRLHFPDELKERLSPVHRPRSDTAE